MTTSEKVLRWFLVAVAAYAVGLMLWQGGRWYEARQAEDNLQAARDWQVRAQAYEARLGERHGLGSAELRRCLWPELGA